MCVWQAAYVRDPTTKGNPKKNIIQYLSQYFEKSPSIKFNPVIFDQTFNVSCYGILLYVISINPFFFRCNYFRFSERKDKMV